MTTLVALIVLTAALLHAVWNALVKGSDDRAIMLGLIALGHFPVGLALIILYPMPDYSAWPWLIASVVVHWVYFWLLNIAYKLGDLSQIYPIARGIVPVLVALVAQFWLGEILPPAAWAGVILVSLGILVLARDAFTGALPITGLIAALAVGGSISVYSLIDGVGIRASGSAGGYIGWLFVAEILVVLFIFPSRMERVRACSAKQLQIGFAGGLVSAMAYALVLYAKTLAPLGLVSALRETSVIFAALIGVLWFKEGPRGWRIVASIIVTAGVIVIGAAS